MEFVFTLLICFVIKHFICDFVLQTNAMVAEKGIYLAPGGIRHASHHALGTLIVILLVFPWGIPEHVAAIVFGFGDGIIHYHIDYIKSRLSFGLTIENQKYWILLGADQAIHYLTYILFVVMILQ